MKPENSIIPVSYRIIWSDIESVWSVYSGIFMAHSIGENVWRDFGSSSILVSIIIPYMGVTIY